MAFNFNILQIHAFSTIKISIIKCFKFICIKTVLAEVARAAAFTDNDHKVCYILEF